MALSDAEVKEKKRINKAKYYAKHRESILAKMKVHRDNNKEEEQIRHKKQYEKNKHKPEFLRKQRESFLKRHYNITIEEYDSMYIEQGGRCAICGIHQSKINRRLEIDHCHETRIVRGLLCHKCNVGLGHFDDNIDILENVLAYLRRAYDGS